MELSQKMEEQIKTYLVESGINSEKINAVGRGELKSNEDSKSRKVKFILSQE